MSTAFFTVSAVIAMTYGGLTAIDPEYHWGGKLIGLLTAITALYALGRLWF